MMMNDIPDFMSEDTAIIFQVIDMRTGVQSEIMAGLPSKSAWNEGGHNGWSVGGLSSGAQLEIDEDLNGIDLGIFPPGNHIYLKARFEPGRTLPAMARDHGDNWARD